MKHKVFISYHHKDDILVSRFIKQFGNSDVFIQKIVGDEYGTLINSNNDDYIMRFIRENFLSDSTVTIVLIGGETYKRMFVDWEIASTLRNDMYNKKGGLIGIFLPGYSEYNTIVPERLMDNVKSGYAKLYNYPQSVFELSKIIEDAYNARISYSEKSDNRRELKKYNG